MSCKFGVVLGWALVLCLNSHGLRGQATQPPNPSPVDAAKPWIEEWDRKVLRPVDLAALRFDFATGSAETPQADRQRVRYAWRRELGDRVDFMDAKGELKPVAPAPTPEPSLKMTQHLQASARNLRQRVLGRGFFEEYGDDRGRVVEETINGEDQVSLVFEPLAPKKVARTTIRVGRDRLPWRTRIEFLNGDEVVLHQTWEARDDRFVLVTVQHLYTPASSTEKSWSAAEKIGYQRVGRYLLLDSVERLSRDLPAAATGTTELANILVDDDVPAFEPAR